MDNYIKTIINGLKAWVTNFLSQLESSVSGSLATMADKLTSLSTKVQKNTTDIAQLQAYEDETNALANQAQTTAQSAQTTATQAQSTASQAQSTAQSAQTTADDNNTAINKATCDNGVLYICINPGVTLSSATMATHINAHLEDGYTSDGFFVWIAKLSNKRSIQYLTFTHGRASFDPAVYIHQGDIIQIYKGENDNAWKAKLTGINLDYQALDSAYTEGVNSL